MCSETGLSVAPATTLQVAVLEALPRAAASGSASYWRAWPGAEPRKRPAHSGSGTRRARLPRGVPGPAAVWTRSCSASRLRIPLLPPAPGCTSSEAGAARREGGRREEEGGSLHTPSSPSTQSSPETAAGAAAFAAAAAAT